MLSTEVMSHGGGGGRTCAIYFINCATTLNPSIWHLGVVKVEMSVLERRGKERNGLCVHSYT